MMTGFDFFQALQRHHVDLPVRIYIDTPVMNLYRPGALSFCDISIDADEELTPESLAFLCGRSVYVIGEEPTDTIRKLTKTLMVVDPSLLVVAAGNTFTSWTHDRGWA